MKIGIEWLKEITKINAPRYEIADKLTSIGLESCIDQSGSILDVSVPFNRSDCYSAIGIGRELSASYNKQFLPPDKIYYNSINVNKYKRGFNLSINNYKKCPIYIGRVILGINNNRKIPPWISSRIIECGIHSISPVVDIINYVMLEMGQPMHIFDFDKINNHIYVRDSIKNEKIKLGNSDYLSLKEDTLVTADKYKILSISGILGEYESKVSNNTHNIFLESAYFDPYSLNESSKRNNTKTESSIRFSRGVDYSLVEHSINKASYMISNFLGGQVGCMSLKEKSDYIPNVRIIKLEKKYIKKILGILPSDNILISIFNNLSIPIKVFNSFIFVTVPIFRLDLISDIDIIEEIFRFIDFNKILEAAPLVNISNKIKPDREGALFKAKECLVNMGYSETISYSFISREKLELFFLKMHIPYILNPISSNMEVMRPSLLPGLIKSLEYNQSRQKSRVRLFELGTIFRPAPNSLNDINETSMLSGVCSGWRFKEQWGEENKNIDFFDIKNDINSLFIFFNKIPNISFINFNANSMFDYKFLDKNNSLLIVKNKKVVGIIGCIDKKILYNLHLTPPVYIYEIISDSLFNNKINEFDNISKFPLVRRDLSIIVNESVISEKIINIVKEHNCDILHDINIFDIYRGSNIGIGKKSISISLFFQSLNRNIVYEEVDCIINEIIKLLHIKVGSIIRDF